MKELFDILPEQINVNEEYIGLWLKYLEFLYRNVRDVMTSEKQRNALRDLNEAWGQFAKLLNDARKLALEELERRKDLSYSWLCNNKIFISVILGGISQTLLEGGFSIGRISPKADEETKEKIQEIIDFLSAKKEINGVKLNSPVIEKNKGSGLPSYRFKRPFIEFFLALAFFSLGCNVKSKKEEVEE